MEQIINSICAKCPIRQQVPQIIGPQNCPKGADCLQRGPLSQSLQRGKSMREFDGVRKRIVYGEI